MTYSIIGILASIVLLISNRDVLWGRGANTVAAEKRDYRNFLIAVLCYYATDALWGVFDALHLTPVQYADTATYFAAMAVAVLLWTRYVISYLGDENALRTALYHAGNLFLAFELIVVIVNFFVPVLFWFDDSGAYHAGSLRYVTLGLQILMFLLTSVYTLHVTAKAQGAVRRRHLTIGLFGIAMIALISFQVAYPLMPFYAMGYLLGTTLLHSFVVEDEKEERRRELEELIVRERLQKAELSESREALSEALAQAEYANRAKTDFLNNMSHDIRTPMNAIVGFTALASSHIDDKEQVRGYLDKISVSSQHLLNLINDVLDMSRIESGKMTLSEADVNLPALIDELKVIIQTSAAEKQLNLLVDTSGISDEWVVIDQLRLNQVFLNILSSAVKFTPPGGTISFRATQKSPLAPGFALFEFRIKDTGIGMSEEFQKTIFESFTREKTSTVSGIQGTGLGMAITKSILDMMGGTISVASAVGEGTEFVIDISCKLAVEPAGSMQTFGPNGADGSKQRAWQDDFAGKRILLVEDNEMNQMIAEAILTEHGFALDIASDGERAVEMVSGAPPGTYDVILMDIQMPKMNGYEASKLIRQLDDAEKASIPIVAVTANAFEEDRKLAFEAGMNGHLAKPYDVPKMMETLADLIEGTQDGMHER